MNFALFVAAVAAGVAVSSPSAAATSQDNFNASERCEMRYMKAVEAQGSQDTMRHDETRETRERAMIHGKDEWTKIMNYRLRGGINTRRRRRHRRHRRPRL